jgi:hypothetical protein
MNFTCQNCHSMIVIPPGERPPPWCSKCGVDFRRDDQRVALLFEVGDETPSGGSTRPAVSKSRARMPAPPDEPTPVPAEAPAKGRKPKPEWDEEPKPEGLETNPDSALALKLLAVAGVIVLLGGIALGVQKYQWVRGCETATGLVVPGDSGPPVVRYNVDGGVYTLRHPKAAPGAVVNVLHRGDDPADAALDDTFALYKTSGLVALIGFGAFLTAVSALALRNPAPSPKPQPAAPAPAE